jgi:hypothetical protein
MNNAQKIKIKEFLKVNLSTLKGAELASFMEKYDIKEAESGEMMLLDMGFPGQFVAFKNEKGSYFVARCEVMEKILVLEPENVSCP